MAVIDVGPGATNRSSSHTLASGYTLVDKNNSANDTGTLDTFEIYANENLSSCKIGTFSFSSPNYLNRDYESIGTVTAGSKQTFTGKNCGVVSGDFLGVGASGGKLEKDATGYSGIIVDDADNFGGGSFQPASTLDGDALSIYATGTTAAAGSLPLKNVFNRPFSGVFR